MNTAEKVARLEAFLQRVQANAKLPRPQRRPRISYSTDVAVGAALAPSDVSFATSAAADAARAAAELEAQRIASERAAKEAAERAAKEAAEIAAAARTAAENAAKEAAERAAKEAAARAAKEAAAKEAAARLAKEAAERVAKEAAERAAKEKAAREAAEKAAAEKAAKEAAEKAAREKAAAEKAAKEAAEKAAREKAAKEAAEKAAREKAAAEKAAKEAAEKAAREKAAAEKAAKEAAEKAAREKAAAEKAAREKAVQEAADRAAKQAADRAAKEAAEAPAKKQPATIDELFAELENAGDATKVGPVDRPQATPPGPAPIKDETTLDTGDMPTVIADMAPMAKSEEDLPTRTAPALPMDAPTRVAAPIASLLEPPTLEGPTIVYGDKPLIDKASEPDEPTVVRRPAVKDQAMARGEEVPTDKVVLGPPAGEEPIQAAPVIAVGEPAQPEERAAPSKPAAGLHERKVELAEPLREQAERAAQEAAERAAQEAALRPKPEKSKEREEITTASRRVVQVTPEMVEEERKAKEREDAEKNKKKGWGSTIGLILATAALVAGGLYLASSKGWFDSSGPPAPTNSVSTAPTGRPPPTSPPSVATTAVVPVAPTGAPSTSTSAAPSGAPTAEPTSAPTASGVSPEAAAKASAAPGIAISEASDDAAKLPATRAFLTVLAPEDLAVYVTGKNVGQTNKRVEVSCPIGLVRVGIAQPSGIPEWRSAPGLSIAIPCRKSTVIAVVPSKGPWPTPGRAPGGGGDPY